VRCGHSEVVFGQGKTPAQVLEIARALLEHHDRVLVTRVEDAAAALLVKELPRAVHHPLSRIVAVEPAGGLEEEGLVLVVSAGTSDEPVAEEAALTARMHGARVERIRDAGVAGIHRLLAHVERLQSAHALVVVAGMEGAAVSRRCSRC
jgi:NCAIR mutase (PurE)-related protein